MAICRFSRPSAPISRSVTSLIVETPRTVIPPTLEQLCHVIGRMPAGTDIERRNRAIVAFIFATGARDRAVVSFKLKHVDLVSGVVYQDAREVRTKNSKTFPTYFFPVGPEIHQIVSDWVDYLRTEKLWGNDDPLFPATDVRPDGSRRFVATGLKRKHWANATPIRKIFRDAFQNAALPYFNPHSVRNTLAQLGQVVCQSPEQFKAWSQNLGHEQVMTSFRSYGHVETRRQAEILRQLSVTDRGSPLPMNERAIEEVARLLGDRLSQRGNGASLGPAPSR